ncbi:MAG: NAD(P) transhydrogenase subunit alpha [Planctomycetes bacterium]|nr:NAD(P) transhydrogenase subunit alpha [Planctomycetota bacterium]
MTGELILGFYIFVLAAFAGVQLIKKVPPTLHTPLMSGANAISGVTILGAMQVAKIDAEHGFGVATFFAVIAVIFATINVVGGFGVTERMLKMFASKKKEG